MQTLICDTKHRCCTTSIWSMFKYSD